MTCERAKLSSFRRATYISSGDKSAKIPEIYARPGSTAAIIPARKRRRRNKREERKREFAREGYVIISCAEKFRFRARRLGIIDATDSSLSIPVSVSVYHSPRSFRLKLAGKSYLENFFEIDFRKQTLFLNGCINFGDGYNLPSYNFASSSLNRYLMLPRC
ncbi:hypothetical protein PUN28_013272 [Cardiocondyla obscurior]|uniref:Uncharacterized protein n=1 Tax=Cardiocondyla obscurior TaxID=286306 RepID=A0AAW2FA65_9HYME